MSRIVAIITSPRRNGCGNAIVSKMKEVLEARGDEVQVFDIAHVPNAKGCQACMACKKTGRCVQKDGIAEVIDAVRDADGVILSTPDFFGQACSQYRMVEDRFYCFFNKDFTTNMPAGKKLACIVTCGGGKPGAVEIEKTMEKVMTGYYKLEPVGSMVYSEKEEGPAADCKRAMDEATALAARF